MAVTFQGLVIFTNIGLPPPLIVVHVYVHSAHVDALPAELKVVV